MADTKISALTAATIPLDGTEVLPIVQAGVTKKVTNNDLRPKQIQSNASSGVLQVVGPAATSTRVMTVPDANFTAARTDSAQTFSGTQTFDNIVFTGGKSSSGAALNMPTATPTTIFSVSSKGVYQVSAQLPAGIGAVSVYMAVATILCDGSAARIIANNGTNLLITLSGLDVQVTQNSGATHDVEWSAMLQNY